MLRSFRTPFLVSIVLSAGLAETRAGDDPRVIPDFVQGLRDKGYYDVALQYLDRLRSDPSTPAEIKATLEYEEGKTLIEEATKSRDPDVSKAKLEQAEKKIKSFVNANPNLPLTTEALIDLADLLFLRAQDEVDIANEARMGNERDSKLIGARGFYASAREAYLKAFERLNTKLAEYPKFIPPADARYRERERIRNSVMQAELKKFVVDYHESQTYPPDSKERNALLEKGLVSFDEFFKRYRTQIAGFTARMWQGKCFEELGKLGEATGIYKELIDHPDPNLRPLQKQVGFFRIIVTGKRKEYARAADECVEWLRIFPKDRRSYEALGVQLELAKSLIAQLPELEGADRDKATRIATDNLTEVVHFVSPFKAEALSLLQKYRPNAALSAADISKLNYDDAIAQAGQAISTKAYENAIALLNHAIAKVGPARDATKLNAARYMLAFSDLMLKRYYEAAVISEHVARKYPRDEWAAKSADLAMQSIIEAYNVYTLGNRTSDLDRLIDLAKYTAATWPETDQGDSARLTMGLVGLGRGDYTAAIAAFDTVRSSSSKWIEAQASCGIAHAKLSVALREQGKAKEADAEVQQALDKLKLALKSRRDANVPDTDINLINNACDLAELELDTNKANDALTMLDPIAKKLAAASNRSAPLNVAYSRVYASILRGHVIENKVDQAIADMKTLEGIGGAGNSSAQLYLDLSRLLEREMDKLKQRKDANGLKKMEQSFQKFLKTLVEAKTGQTFQSLQWAADNLLKLGSPREANEVYTTLVDTYAKDPAFVKNPKSGELVYLVRLKKVAALREIGSLPEAEKLLNELIEQNKRSLEAQMEKGYLLSAQAEAKKGKWLDAYSHWKGLASKLVNQSPKPSQYYEAWYQAAVALQKQGQKDLARTTIASIMRLSRDVGSPEMKAKYEALLKQLMVK